MGKVTKKTGFLGFGKTIEEYSCDKCRINLPDNRFWDEGMVYCKSCADKIDLSIAHSWDKLNIVDEYRKNDFFIDTSDMKNKYIHTCYRCHGLIVYHLQQDNKYYCKYYRVGHDMPMDDVFICEEHSGYNEDGNVESQANCQHSWITIATSRQTDDAAHAKYKRLMGTRNYTLERMYGTDEIDIQYQCFGATYYWCFNCGLFRRLNPQREHLLKKYGVR